MVRDIEAKVAPDEWYNAVQALTVADIEEISISDISSLENNSLKDLINHAVTNRLASHLGGTYTSPPKGSIAEHTMSA
ncbi:hypothetical protein AB0D32_26015 [Micromonospora sp. NPDC048170]|uniref:hypothetical protein n=1 Tax=Micromonospora sp. NPDC048170 TaxID=3154819 RepID=UPI0034084C9D